MSSLTTPTLEADQGTSEGGRLEMASWPLCSLYQYRGWHLPWACGMLQHSLRGGLRASVSEGETCMLIRHPACRCGGTSAIQRKLQGSVCRHRHREPDQVLEDLSCLVRHHHLPVRHRSSLGAAALRLPPYPDLRVVRQTMADSRRLHCLLPTVVQQTLATLQTAMVWHPLGRVTCTTSTTCTTITPIFT